MSKTQNTSTENTTADTTEVEAPVVDATPVTEAPNTTEVVVEAEPGNEETEQPATGKAGREAAKYRTQLRTVEAERDTLKEQLAAKETELAVINIDRQWNITNKEDVEMLLNVTDLEQREALAKRLSVNNSIPRRKDTSNETPSELTNGPSWSAAMNGDWK